MPKTSKRTLLQLIPCLVVLAVIMLALGECSQRREARQETRRSHQQTAAKERQQEHQQEHAQLTQALQYLLDLPEVAWVEIDDNDVYVGFTAWPEDGELVLKGAALRGEEVLDFGCHVWGVRATHRGWRPGDGSYFAQASARYGKLVR